MEHSTFSRRNRLQCAAEFAAVRADGVSVASSAMKLVGVAKPTRRVGIIVSKVVGNAVVRNRVRRVVREHFRLGRERYPQAHCVVIARREAAKLSGKELRIELDRLVAKLAMRLK